MDNACLYLAADESLNAQRLQSMFKEGLFPEATLRSESPEAFVIDCGESTLTFRSMPQEERSEHLNGFCGFVVHCCDGPEGIEALLARIQESSAVIGITIEEAHDEKGLSRGLIVGLARASGALIFGDDSLYGPDGRLILGAEDARPIFGGSGYTEDPEALARRKQIEEAAAKPPTAKSLARKEKSIASLKKLGVQVNENQPCLIDEADANPRVQEEVLNRALCLAQVAMVAAAGTEKAKEVLSSCYCQSGFSPREQSFLSEFTDHPEAKAEMTWCFEPLYVMLWALGYIDELGLPESQCDAQTVIGIMTDLGVEKFRGGAKLRSVAHILDEADLAYRISWAMTDSRLNNQPPPGSLEPGPAVERHTALNWLYGYLNQDWDHVTADT